MIVAGCIFLIDILQYKKFADFGIIYGSNAIAIYVLADILAILFYGITLGGGSLNEHFFNLLTSIGTGPRILSMLYAIIFVGINFIPAYILHKRNILIRL